MSVTMAVTPFFSGSKTKPECTHGVSASLLVEALRIHWCITMMDLNEVPNQPCAEEIASNVFQALLFRIENQAWVYTRRERKPVGSGSSNKIPHTGASPNRNKIESACTCEENSALLHVLARTCKKNMCRWGEGHERRRKTRRLATGKRGGWRRKTRRLAPENAAVGGRSGTRRQPQYQYTQRPQQSALVLFGAC